MPEPPDLPDGVPPSGYDRLLVPYRLNRAFATPLISEPTRITASLGRWLFDIRQARLGGPQELCDHSGPWIRSFCPRAGCAVLGGVTGRGLRVRAAGFPGLGENGPGDPRQARVSAALPRPGETQENTYGNPASSSSSKLQKRTARARGRALTTRRLGARWGRSHIALEGGCLVTRGAAVASGAREGPGSLRGIPRRTLGGHPRVQTLTGSWSPPLTASRASGPTGTHTRGERSSGRSRHGRALHGGGSRARRRSPTRRSDGGRGPGRCCGRGRAFPSTEGRRCGLACANSRGTDASRPMCSGHR